MSSPSSKSCLSKGYDAIQTANFWAAVGDIEQERSALSTAREWFDKPPLHKGRSGGKGRELRQQVDARIRQIRE